jgi:hypothetical protein
MLRIIKLGCLVVFGQKEGHAPISTLEKLDTAKFKAFSRKRVKKSGKSFKKYRLSC